MGSFIGSWFGEKSGGNGVRRLTDRIGLRMVRGMTERLTSKELAHHPDRILHTVADEEARTFLAHFALLDTLLSELANLRQTGGEGGPILCAVIAYPLDPTHWIFGLAGSDPGEEDLVTVSAFAFPKSSWSSDAVIDYIRKQSGANVTWQVPLVDPNQN